MKSETETDLEQALELVRQATTRIILASGEGHVSKLQLARTEQDYVHLRQKILPESWQPLPAWSVIVELYLAHHEHRKACVKHVTVAASAPAATVLRHVDLLISEGWVNKWPSKVDRRVNHLSLTRPAFKLVDSWLRTRAKQSGTNSQTNALA